jgi:hypothetical protein
MESIEEVSGADPKTQSAAGLQKRLCGRSWRGGEASEEAIQVFEMDMEDYIPQCFGRTGVHQLWRVSEQASSSPASARSEEEDACCAW